MKTLIVCKSIHHKNTEKIAHVFAEVLAAQVETPEQTDADELRGYDLVGFGSGIYAAKHHDTVLKLANRLPPVTDKRAFIFSTSGILTKRKVASDHSALRGILESKGYTIVDEFGCLGFNTNAFLKYFGGMNKGRPNAEDLARARQFASNLRQDVRGS